MAGRFAIRNKSQFPDAEVRELVKFAMGEVDTRSVCVNVKRMRGSGWRGWAYEGVPEISNAPRGAEYLITLAVGDKNDYPMKRPARRRGEPHVEFETWQEIMVFLAAHEAKHIEQYRENLPRSEVRCNVFATSVLDRYRQEAV